MLPIESDTADINKAKPTIRDILAIERTILASERTFLAYSRTALALVIAGLSFFEFANSLLLKIIALTIIPLGVAVLIFGILRFNKKKKAIRSNRLLAHYPQQKTPV